MGHAYSAHTPRGLNCVVVHCIVYRRHSHCIAPLRWLNRCSRTHAPKRTAPTHPIIYPQVIAPLQIGGSTGHDRNFASVPGYFVFWHHDCTSFVYTFCNRWGLLTHQAPGCHFSVFSHHLLVLFIYMIASLQVPTSSIMGFSRFLDVPRVPKNIHIHPKTGLFILGRRFHQRSSVRIMRILLF